MSDDDSGVLAGVSVAHNRASVAEIERAAGDSHRTVVSELLDEPGVHEAFALQTCNRAEAYVFADGRETARAAVAGRAPEVPDGAIRRLGHEESIRHLMRVAAGLESLVLGEDQILGQFKRAIEDARTAGGLGGRLDETLTKAAHVGERARAETAINEGTVSLGTAAVELVDRETTLADATALVVGAGEIGALVARRLADAPVDRVLIANRTVPTAEHVAADLETDAGALSLSEIPATIERVDVLVAATSAPGYVIDAETLAGDGPSLCVDLAQPRDVEPDAAEHVILRDIDDLESVTSEARASRGEAVAAVERLIDEEFDRLIHSFKRERADEAIAAMYAAAERVRDEQVERAIRKLEGQGGLTAAQRETVESLADALVGQLLAAPTKSLREAAGSDDWATIYTAMELFDPGFDEIDPSRLPDAGSGPVAAGEAEAQSSGESPDELPDGRSFDGETGDTEPDGRSFDPDAVSSDAVDPDDLPDEVPDAVRSRFEADDE